MTSHPKTAGEVLGDHGPVEEKTIGEMLYQATGENSGWKILYDWSRLGPAHRAAWERVATRFMALSQPTKEGEGK